MEMAHDVRWKDYPSYGKNLFAIEALKNPFPLYREIRDLGAVVHIETMGIAAISRFKDVQAALRNSEKLISGEGIGFNSFANHQTPERGVLTSDGQRHRRLRNILAKPLMPAALKEVRGMLGSLIEAKVRSLKGAGTFDAVPELARHLPLNAVTKLVGLAESERGKMLRWASAFFNTLGPINEVSPAVSDFSDDIENLKELRSFFSSINPKSFEPDSWSAKLFEAVDDGRLSEPEARGALRAFVIPSLDTTIYAKGNLLYNLATNPDQWALLKAQPELIPSAVIESVRHSAVVRAFSRVAVETYEEGDVFVPAGQRVMVMYGSANRDEHHYPNPDQFVVTRKAVDQLGWGTGPHMCVGMHLAKLEMEVLLEALVNNVDHLEADTPQMGTNAGLYGIDSVNFRLM